MKILFYINILNSGGAERVISNLANSFVQQNEIIVVNTYKVANEYPLDENVIHEYLEEDSSSNLIARNINRIKSLREVVKKHNPDICVSFMAEPNIRMLISTIGLKTKLLLSVRNDPNKEYSTKLSKYLMFTLGKRADGIVFQTTDAKKFFPDDIQKKSKIIYNPVNSKFYNDNNYSVKNKGIVSVGRLSEQKNFSFLINAFHMIADKIDDNLYIYGEGSLKDELKHQISKLNLENRVFLMGNSTELQDLLSNYRLFVLPSDYEGLPNALMEAMAIGLPCISTDCPCGGPKELLSSECLVMVRNEKEMSSKLLSMLTNDSLLVKSSLENKKKALTFKNDVITDVWYKYIEEIVEED